MAVEPAARVRPLAPTSTSALRIIRLCAMIGGIANRFRRRPARPTVLVHGFYGLGDTVIAAGFMREVKAHLPNVKVVAFVRPIAATLLQNEPYIDRVVVVPAFGKTLSAIRKFALPLWEGWRLGPYEFVFNALYRVNTPNDLVSHSIGALFGPSRTVVHQLVGEPAGVFGTVVPDDPAEKHDSLRYADLLRAVTSADTYDPKPRLELTDEEVASGKRHIRSLPERKHTIAISFGASENKRRWPVEMYAEAVNRSALSASARVVVVCPPTDAAVADALIAQLSVPSCRVTAESLREVASVIKQCDVFLGADSALSHIAGAVGARCVIVSCHPQTGTRDHHNSPVRFAPLAPNTIVLQPPRPRPGCHNGCDNINPHCILDVTPAEVAEALDRVLEPINGTARK